MRQSILSQQAESVYSTHQRSCGTLITVDQKRVILVVANGEIILSLMTIVVSNKPTQSRNVLNDPRVVKYNGINIINITTTKTSDGWDS